MPRVPTPLLTTARLRTWARLSVRMTAWALVATASIVLGLWILLQWLILPRLQTWQPELEQGLARALGTPVRMAGIEVRGNLWAPVVVVRGFQVLDAEGQPGLQLAQVEATLTPGSLLPRSWGAWQPHLDRIDLQSPELTVRRHADGRLSMGGIPIAPGDANAPPSAAADWILTQGRWNLRSGRLQWIDDQRPNESLQLENVDVDLRHHAGRHQLTVAASPPAAIGQRISLEADLKSPLWARLKHPGDWTRWQGTVKARAPQLDWAAMRPWMPVDSPIQDAVGGLNAVVRLDRGNWIGLESQLNLSRMRIQGADPAQSLVLSQAKGSLSVTRQPGRRLKVEAKAWSFDVAPLAKRTAHRWTPSDWDLDLTGPENEWTAGTLSASRLDLETLATMASTLMPAGEAREDLLQAAPAGAFHGIDLKWTGPWRHPERWSVQGRGTDLALKGRDSLRSTAAHPLPGRPGLQGAAVQFQADEKGGKAMIALRKGSIDFPGVFEIPRVPFDRLDADLQWSGGARDLKVQVLRATFANADAEGKASGHWQAGDGRKHPRLPGILALETQLTRAQARSVHRYLPLQLPPATRAYVREGFQSGHAREVTARVQGPLDRFPWADGRQGTFRIDAQVEDLVYNIVPTAHDARDRWPLLTGVTGLLSFEGQGMLVKNARAGLARTGSGTFALSSVNARIDDFVNDPVLRIEGRGQGPLQDGLRYVAESPVGRWIHDVLAPASATGQAALDLALVLPLDHIDRSTVKGRVTLERNTLRLRPDVPRLDAAQGQVEFDEKGFTLKDTTALSLGGAVTLTGGSQPDGTIRVTGQGSATASGLREAPELGFVAPLARFLSGESPYRLDLSFTPKGMSLQVDSPLTGLALQAPAPFSKTAAATLPLQVKIQPAPDTPGSRPLESVRVDLGSLLRAQYQRDLSATSAVQRGWIQVGAAALASPAGWPQRGVRLQIDLPATQAEHWLNWQDQAENVGLLERGPSREDSGYAPDEILMRTANLQVGPRQFTQVVAKLKRDTRKEGQVWSGPVQADQLAGSVAMLLPFDAQQSAQLRARLSRLALPDDTPSAATRQAEAAATNATAAAAESESPRRLPDIDLEADRFRLGQKDLGKLVLQAGHQTELGSEQSGAWLLRRLSLQHEHAELHAVGRWMPPRPGQTTRSATRMTFRLDVADAGGLLSQMGQPGAMRGGKGFLAGQLDWQGSPTQFNIASLAGQMDLELQRGQFLQAEPGVARLLGVLSLQSLPRRLLLDFRDVFQQGFSFDQIDGQVKVQRGVAVTRNLRMRGVQAMVLTEGQADLAGETQNLRVWVVPDINAGAASLAYAVINPAIGLGTFIGQLFLSKPLTEAATREFLVTGTWDEPKVAPAALRTPVPTATITP